MTTAAARFLDPRALARIANLELAARTVVEGFISGLHESPFIGASVDFAEHRPYMPGDDIRRIDWRVFGRTDRYYVKEFEADTNANFTVLLDVSASMGFGSAGITKLDYAKYLAACLTWFSRQQRDRVGLVTFADDIVSIIPPSAKHLDPVLHELDRARAAGRGNLHPPLSKVAEFLRRRSIVVLISDLYEPADQVIRAVNLLRARGNDLIVFQVLDRAELDFPYDEASQFEDLESGERIPVVPDKVRSGYRELLERHTRSLREGMVRDRIDYRVFDTTRPLDLALFEFLAFRHRLVKVR
ncbi:MAG: DUF58 domain-containing protein [Gemmatimonadales bacterium]